MWVYFLMPLVTAGIGWLTNWLAIKMLFLPLDPVKLFPGVKLQGLIPRRQGDLARQVAEIIERELINQHMIREAVESVGVGDMVEEKVRGLIREKLVKKLQAIPMLGSLLNDDSIAGLESYVVQELRGMSENLAVDFADQVEGRLQVRHLVQERIESFDLLKLKKIVESVAAKEFKTIELVGAILGGLIGVLQSLYFLLIQGDLL
jgi:uncharacterized membrane protein YheB (UPF0754 family)